MLKVTLGGKTEQVEALPSTVSLCLPVNPGSPCSMLALGVRVQQISMAKVRVSVSIRVSYSKGERIHLPTPAD